MKKIVLASTSVYRQQLLSRLQREFECRAPGIDETPRPQETPEQLVLRLAAEKALAVAQAGELVIGSDQVAVLKDRILGKPLTQARARQQLLACQGQFVTFLTGLCLVDNQQLYRVDLDRVVVRFRQLSEAEIDRYLNQEQVLDCAGSFKAEGLGISLFDAIDSQDPNSLIGLPLIRLSQWLRECGVPLP